MDDWAVAVLCCTGGVVAIRACPQDVHEYTDADSLLSHCPRLPVLHPSPAQPDLSPCPFLSHVQTTDQQQGTCTTKRTIVNSDDDSRAIKLSVRSREVEAQA